MTGSNRSPIEDPAEVVPELKRRCDYLVVLAWVFFLSVLGVTMAIPMKRQMINVEQLRFPSGIAAAETLAALVAGSAALLAQALSEAAADEVALTAGLLKLAKLIANSRPDIVQAEYELRAANAEARRA